MLSLLTVCILGFGQGDKNDFFFGRVFGLEVGVLTFFSGVPSSNPAKVYILSLKLIEKNEKNEK